MVDTGFGMVTDVGTAAAVGSIGTGSVGAAATIGAPVVVTAAAGYAVTKAVEEGLKTYEAFKVEEISEKISNAKKTEVINTLQMNVENLLKQGETTGDWRYFAKADEITESLERLYTVTGDKELAQKHDQNNTRMRELFNTNDMKMLNAISALSVPAAGLRDEPGPLG